MEPHHPVYGPGPQPCKSLVVGLDVSVAIQSHTRRFVAIHPLPGEFLTEGGPYFVLVCEQLVECSLVARLVTGVYVQLNAEAFAPCKAVGQDGKFRVRTRKVTEEESQNSKEHHLLVIKIGIFINTFL